VGTIFQKKNGQLITHFNLLGAPPSRDLDLRTMADEILAEDVWGDDDDDDEDSDEEESNDDYDDDSGDEYDDSDDDIDEFGEIGNDIVEKFILTLHNGNYDDEIDESLRYDRREALSLPAYPTQASYNKPDNWVERNRIGLEKMKRPLQSCINKLMMDNLHSVHICLSHNPFNQLADNEESIVWHEPILDDYWDQLEAKFHWRTQHDIVTDIHSLQFMNIEMTKERLAALVDIFRSERATNSIPLIVFDNVNLCGEGIVLLSKLVDVSLRLSSLHLCHNRIDNMELARCLTRSVRSHNRLTALDLTHCDLGSSPEMLLVILQSDVNQIILSNNNIDSLGAVKIAEYLEGNPPIKFMSLDHNRLNDDDAIILSRALKTNMNLRHLHLWTNEFSSVGVKALLTCVFDNSNLNAMSESNHTLVLMNFFDDKNTFSYELRGCIKRLLGLDRIQKIMLALQDKESLLKYLVNVPVELMPEVLFFPLRQVDDQMQHRYLNVLYSTMRWWNMPMLYSYHHCCAKSNTKRKRNKE
jgi:hypothetical protein